MRATDDRKAQKRKESRQKRKHFEELERIKQEEELKRKLAAERAEREKGTAVWARETKRYVCPDRWSGWALQSWPRLGRR